MELTVTHVVRESPSSLPSDAPFGSRPSGAALLDLAVSTIAVPPFGRGTALSDTHSLASNPTVPIQATPFILDAETTYPQRMSDSDHTLNPDANARSEASTAHSILVVEDDPDITMGLQDLLESKGFHVDCVQTCRQAVSSIEQNTYHAVLLDLGLPDGDGCSILEKLQVSHPSLPVIVLTASNRNLGSLRVYAHLTKPWDRGELCGILHRAIGTGSSSTVR